MYSTECSYNRIESPYITYEEFLDNHPIIYWQDPFGDFMEFKDAKCVVES